jgi:hypothetical protein
LHAATIDDRHVHAAHDHEIHRALRTARSTARRSSTARGGPRSSNLYLCGTDQGFLGIVGAMLSGISMANYHILQKAVQDARNLGHP